MSGYAIWGHDIGGYENSHYSPARADLFMRWTQFGCFSPIMQMHRQVSPAPGNLQQYPWGYAAPEETADANQALENYRFYARLHTRLFPYLYTLAKRASETGLPILRPLVLMHQSDPRTFAVDDAYYFGDALLVAPVLEAKATSRDVYLPEGTWFDFWSGDRREGGRFVRWSDPDAKRLPLYARAGAILPMLANDADTLCDADYVDNPAIASPADGLLIRVYPGGDARFTVHDGTDIRCRGSDAAVEVTIDGRDRPLSLELHATTAPRDVTLGGSALPRLASSAYDAAPSGWNHDPDARLLRVKFAQQGVAARLIAVFR
jgi:alpha-glucosidase (family GH31 glycosyl hydrolase)